MAKATLDQDVKKVPPQIRVSVGTATVLGLLEGKLDAEPKTAYLMTYKEGKCTANCGFCPQARTSQSKAEFLSRVTWPTFSTNSVIELVANASRFGKIRRVCIQALNYPEVFDELCGFVQALKRQASVPVSVSCQPQNSRNMWRLLAAGVDRIGIALDAATEKIFNEIKGESAGGPYTWDNEFVLLRTALGIFGEGNVSTHLIIGLGETEREAAQTLQRCVDIGVLPSLFAFTPVRGTAFAAKTQPKPEVYRRIQMIRHLMVNGQARFDDMAFDRDGHIENFGVGKNVLEKAFEGGKPFLTAGCADCNRPFYNEKPSGPIYNYPRSLNEQEIAEIKLDLKKFLK